MQRDPDYLRQQAKRTRQWAIETPDPEDRERLEGVARDYEQMAAEAEEQGHVTADAQCR